jgi:hypothetical protein
MFESRKFKEKFYFKQMYNALKTKNLNGFWI